MLALARKSDKNEVIYNLGQKKRIPIFANLTKYLQKQGIRQLLWVKLVFVNTSTDYQNKNQCFYIKY